MNNWLKTISIVAVGIFWSATASVLVPLFTTEQRTEGRDRLRAMPSGEEEGEANKRQFPHIAKHGYQRKDRIFV
ncbi:MAG: hypothetical protein K2K83_00410 [Rikenella sp.]|nr:hypothetical protein [Rikenella sp.]